MNPHFWQTFPVSGDFTLKPRPPRKLRSIDESPEKYTTDQLLLRATMKKYGLTVRETAAIFSVSINTIFNYLTPPTSSHYREMPSTYPALLDSYCRAHKKQ